jgi:acetyl esterase/lipase
VLALVVEQQDATDDIRESLTYYLALEQAKILVEMHLYAKGGHAFGLRKTVNPITNWPVLAEKWMSALAVIPSTGP